MEEKKPLISVIVPVYNVEKYLHKCVDSILAQTLKDFELILVDDGSPDNCGAICDEYAKKDGRVKVIHKPNGGVSSARNAGIEIAAGKWLCFVDSDDWVDTTYLSSFKLEDGVDYCLQGYREVLPNGTVCEVHSFKSDKDVLTNEIIVEAEKNYTINSPCFKLFRVSIINEHCIRFDNKTSYGEDHLFNYEYLRYTNRINCDVAVGYNVNRGIVGSLSTKLVPFEQISYFTEKIYKLQLEYIERNSDMCPALVDILSHRLYLNVRRMIFDCYKRGTHNEEVSKIRRIIKNHERDFSRIGLKHIIYLWYFILTPAFVQKLICKV